MAEGPTAEPKPDLNLTGTQLSWMRSDLANLRTLMAWSRTAVSMIGFGFTIFNFYHGFLQDLIRSGRQDAARNLGLALVAAGTVAMVVALWNYRSVNQSLVAMEGVLDIPASFKRRWIYSYVLSAVLVVIGFVTLLFMLRVL